uniref:Sigma-54-dependent Fis family transcriptional regulator n=1 Tax=candidate division WOR-3 bacterium TaxID=2052148 RepID=A0A7C4YD17_UNCW3
MPKIILVEDIDNFRDMIKRYLEENKFDVVALPDAEMAIRKIDEEIFDAGIFDIRLKGISGIKLLERIRDKGFNFPVFIITAYGDIETAVEAMKKGATDFLQKPFDPDILVMKLKKCIEERNRGILGEKTYEIVGRSQGIIRAKELALKVSKTDANVLITGESGTGKELFARLIHNMSSRRDKPFVVVNASAIPETLIESELFGIERGTATGVEGRIGKIELANGGTLFFDEIGDTPLSLQAKILRVIEEKKIMRVGGRKEITVDVRFIFATNKELKEEVKNSRFREDLFYRINVFPIELPPLRERIEDIPLLVQHFIKKYSFELKKKVTGIEDDALKRLQEYRWVGNVRELENIIERAIIISEGEKITDKDIFITQKEEKMGLPLDLKEAGRIGAMEAERIVILRALNITKGNKLKASRLLKVSYKTLLTKMKEIGIEGDKIEKFNEK